jgi:alcohol dehydrogenase (NADP+)
MEQNLAIRRLPDKLFEEVDALETKRGGPTRFLDPGKHLGFDIFDEDEDQPVGNGAPWDWWDIYM